MTAPDLSPAERAVVERFDAAPPVCLSCDQAEDALARVLALADELTERGRENERVKDPLYATPETYLLRAGAFYEAADRIRAAVEGS